jgi:hypothetical protein
MNYRVDLPFEQVLEVVTQEDAIPKLLPADQLHAQVQGICLKNIFYLFILFCMKDGIF